MKRIRGISYRMFPLGLLLTALLGPMAVADPPPEIGWGFRPTGVWTPRVPAQPPEVPVELILDDGTAEGDFGFSGVGVTAKQFLWFNQFALPAGGGSLEEIWVLFLPGPNMDVGHAVQLAVYHDPDSDPTNGATLLATWDAAIQAVDGLTFSVYPLAAPLALPSGGDLLVGVISRFVESNVTTSTYPGALDTSTNQSRSWVAVWTGDPPASPALPPNLLIDRVDRFRVGNWMIRAYGFRQVAQAVHIPTLDTVGLALLVILLGGAAMWRERRRPAGSCGRSPL